MTHLAILLGPITVGVLLLMDFLDLWPKSN